MKLVGQRGVAIHQKRTQSKQFLLFCAFLASAQNPKILHFPARRSLLNAQRIAHESEMRLRKETGYNTDNQGNEYPGGEKADACRKAPRSEEHTSELQSR